MTDFVSQMVAVRNKVAGLAGRFGNPDIAGVVVRRQNEDGFYSYLQITPDPVVREDLPEIDQVRGVRSVEALRKAFVISGIGRHYKEESLRGPGMEYLVGARMVLNKPVGGVLCQFVSLEEKFLTWELRAIEKISEQQIYEYI